uniref:Putative secreted protein n=1 Tax=Ixodes scapularis TaxID=6945 RepID=A0A4D5RDY6_IXOSC
MPICVAWCWLERLRVATVCGACCTMRYWRMASHTPSPVPSHNRARKKFDSQCRAQFCSPLALFSRNVICHFLSLLFSADCDDWMYVLFVQECEHF